MQTHHVERGFETQERVYWQIIKHKALIIVKGYSQRYGLDFIDMFAPMIRLKTIRVLLAMSTYFGWEVMKIIWPSRQSHFYLLFLFVEIKFYLLLFLCDVCNNIYERLQ